MKFINKHSNNGLHDNEKSINQPLTQYMHIQRIRNGSTQLRLKPIYLQDTSKFILGQIGLSLTH